MKFLVWVMSSCVALSVVGHYWPHALIRITRLHWWLALGMLTCLAFVALRLPLRWLEKKLAAQTTNQRYCLIGLCIFLAVAMQMGAVWRTTTWGNVLAVHGGTVRGLLVSILIAADAAIIFTAILFLSLLTWPNDPPVITEQKPTLASMGWLHRFVILVVPAAFITALVLWHTGYELTAHYWDNANYWLVCSDFSQQMQDGPLVASRSFWSSLGDNDYTLLPAVLPSLVMIPAGDSRRAYQLAQSLIYGTLVCWTAVAAVRGMRQHSGHTFGLGAAMAVLWVTLLCPMLWDATMRGYLDLGGVGLALVIFRLYLTRRPSVITRQQALVLAILAVTLVLFRRWYSFWVVAFFATAGAEFTLASIMRLTRKKWPSWSELRPIVLAATWIVFLFSSFAWNALLRIYASDYAVLYAGYRSTRSWHERIVSLLEFIGYGYVILFAAAAVLVIARSETRRIALYAVIMAVIIIVHFYRVQDMGFHHRLLLVPSFIVVVSLALCDILTWRLWLRMPVLLLLAGLSVIGFVLSFAPQYHAQLQNVFPWLTNAPAYPERRDDTSELLALANDANDEAGRRQSRFVILASSDVLNQWHILTVHRSLGVPHPKPFRQVIITEVDLVSGFPDGFFEADVVAVPSPPQTHMRPEQQSIILGLSERVQKGYGLGAAYQRIEKTYQLRSGVTVSLYVRTRSTTPDEIQEFLRMLQQSHPTNAHVFTPRCPVANCN